MEARLSDSWIPTLFTGTELTTELSLKVARAAQFLRTCRAALSGLLSGKAALSPEIARLFEKPLTQESACWRGQS